MRRVALAVPALAALVVAAGCGSSADSSGEHAGAQVVAARITDEGCEPARIEVPAGPVTFKVAASGSGKVTEFEVLDGDRILGEVENLVPGIERSFSLTLAQGAFTTYCPNGSRERGELIVTGTSQAASADVAAQLAAVQAYRRYALGQATLLVQRTDAFTAAVLAGDIATAKARFASAREPWERIEPIAESLAGLDPAIDARAGDVPATRWTGFHRLEKALWVDGSTAGTARIAGRLRRDVRRARAVVQSATLQPAQIANGAKGLLDEVAASKVTGEEDRYSHTDLWDFAANVDGSRAAFTALRPLIAARDPELAREVAERFAAADRALAPYRRGTGFVRYTVLTEAQTRELARRIDELAEPVGRIAAAVNT
jgi:iron uptake system component EfeO